MIEDPNRTDNKILEYLITSNTRRNLLALLWGKGISGSSAQLSELVGSARSGVHAELRAMLRVELAVSTREKGVEVFSANFTHPLTPVLKIFAGALPASS